MGTSLDVSLGTTDINTAFEIWWLDAFENPNPVGGFQQVTQLINTSAKKLDLNTFGPGPVMRQWLGEKVFKRFRHYDHSVEGASYEKSIALDAIDVEQDPSGIFMRKLAQWFGTGGDVDLDKIVHDVLVSNSGTGPTCYDGVTLLNNSHPHLNGGAGYDNLTTNALSFAAYDAGVQAVTSVRNEEDESLDLMPTLLRVGPKNRKIAFEIANINSRALPLNAAGVEASSSVVTSSSIGNVFAGEVLVEINKRYVGSYDDYWDLVDASNAMRLPMGFMLQKSPELISLDRPTDPNRFYSDEHHHSIELRGRAFGAFFAAMYGGRL